MKIREKITFFTSAFLIVMVTFLTTLSVNNIKTQGEKRLASFKKEAIDDVKSNLKNLVDVAYATIDNNHKKLSNTDYLGKFYERRLHDIINTGEAIIERYQKQVNRGQLSLNSAKRQAMTEIKALRFDGGTGYIWINDIGQPYPKMVMHPTIPSLDGKVLDNPQYNNALGIGKNLFVAFVDITADETEGFVDYLWPKPTPSGLTEEVPKLSYVRRYNEWGWILGTGIYIDDARRDIENRIKEVIKTMRYDQGVGYFWINDNSKPYAKMVMHPTVPTLDGKLLNDPRYNNAQGIDKNLFNAFVEVTEKDGDGFVDYLWPKPTASGLTARKEKISYVKLHKPLGWIIGSGVYIDNIDEILAQKKREIGKQVNTLIIRSVIFSLIFIILAVLASYLFSATLANPIKHLTALSEQISKGKNLDQTIDEINRDDEIGELAKSIDRLKSSVKIMLSRMQKKQ
ncbi:MAG: cache domain-containing protein [Cellvibrionaceae bacterium]|nr:cache domain-containing protein [Cellvibrionaceae bacterium]